MKNFISSLVFISTLLGLGSSQIVLAVVTSQQAEEIFNLAEQVFPQYFSPPLSTQTFPPNWQYYRGPYNNNIYAGINADDSVYVLGGPFGNEPFNVGSNQDVLQLLQNNSNNGGGSTDSICNTNNLPEGLNFSQNGNVVNVSTDGCIVLPKNENICSSPVTPQSTGISVLTEINVISSEFSGVSSTNPAILDSLNTSGMSSFCTVNAAANYAPSTINLDVCFDITEQTSQFSSIPGVTITPPVTQTLISTQNNSVVDDCFNTGAQTIIDNVNGDIWILQNGSYTMVPNI